MAPKAIKGTTPEVGEKRMPRNKGERREKDGNISIYKDGKT